MMELDIGQHFLSVFLNKIAELLITSHFWMEIVSGRVCIPHFSKTNSCQEVLEKIKLKTLSVDKTSNTNFFKKPHSIFWCWPNYWATSDVGKVELALENWSMVWQFVNLVWWSMNHLLWSGSDERGFYPFNYYLMSTHCFQILPRSAGVTCSALRAILSNMLVPVIYWLSQHTCEACNQPLPREKSTQDSKWNYNSHV